MRIEGVGRALILMGALVVIVGVVFLLGRRLSVLGHLLGAFSFRSGSVSCFILLATSLLLSIVRSPLLNLISNLLQRP